MNRNNKDKKDDNVLRAKDIIPPFNDKITNQQKSPASKIPPNAEIPQFDLAQQIMNEQRKVSAIKRQAPGQKNQKSKQLKIARPPEHTKKPPMIPSQSNRIIADIVARDIRNLRKNKSL